MPHYFVSYSLREPHIENLLDALHLVLGTYFEQRRTPTALKSGESQYEQIIQGIHGASFGVVILDGLRPNVVFEYGIMVGMNVPVLLFMEASAEVDVPGFFPEGPTVEVKRTILSIDSHFSDIKDQYQAKWFKFNPKETRRVVLAEYEKKRGQIKDFVEIKRAAELFE